MQDAALRCPSGLQSPSAPSSAGPSQSADSVFEDFARSSPTDYIRAWRKGTLIGRGSQGGVYRAIDRDTGMIFAAKEAILRGDSDEAERQLKRLRAEVEILRAVDHPNLVRLLGCEASGKALYIFMEFMGGGSVASTLKEFGPLSPALLRSATRQACAGLDHLHSRDVPIVHRDVKGDNLLMDDGFNIKLADFGCSKQAADTQSFTFVGSLPWMAPELFMNEAGHGRKADIWSLGCTVLEMASAKRPWAPAAVDNIGAAIRLIGMSDASPPIPEEVPAAGRDFVEKCLCRTARDRSSANKLLEHAFVMI